MIHPLEGGARRLIGAVLEEEFHRSVCRHSDHQKDDGQEAEDNHPGQECEVDVVFDPHHGETGAHHPTGDPRQRQAQCSTNEADAPTNGSGLMAQ